jgi:hypothetical protein
MVATAVEKARHGERSMDMIMTWTWRKTIVRVVVSTRANLLLLLLV